MATHLPRSTHGVAAGPHVPMPGSLSKINRRGTRRRRCSNTPRCPAADPWSYASGSSGPAGTTDHIARRPQQPRSAGRPDSVAAAGHAPGLRCPGTSGSTQASRPVRPAPWPAYPPVSASSARTRASNGVNHVGPVVRSYLGGNPRPPHCSQSYGRPPTVSRSSPSARPLRQADESMPNPPK